MPRGSARAVFSLSRGDGDSVDQPSGKAYVIPDFGKLAWSKEHSQSEQGVRWGKTLQIDGWMKRLPGMSTLSASAGNQVGDKPFSAPSVVPGVFSQHWDQRVVQPSISRGITGQKDSIS